MGKVLARIALAAAALAIARSGDGQEWWVDCLCIVVAIILIDAREAVSERIA